MGVRRTAWLLAALVVGVALACDPGGWSPFGPAKWFVVSVVGAGLVAGAVPVVRLERREQLVLGGFLALIVLAAVFGIDGRYAWLGTPERHFGVVTWVIVGGAYVAGRSLNPSGVRVVARAAVVAAGVIAVWSVFELVWGPPIELATRTDRLTGPFGSAAFLGAGGLLFGFVAAGVALDSTERRVWRIIAAPGALGCVVAVAGSGARAAWIGGVVGAIVLGRRHLRWVVAAVVLAAIVMAPKLGDVLDRSAGAGSRLDEWRVAVRVIADHPFVGVGPEGYRIAFSEGVDDDYERSYGRAVLPDRAHSAPLDVAVTAGVPAALLWLAAVAFVARRSWVAARRGSVLVLGLGAASAAFLAQELLLFPTMEFDAVAWAFAGMMVTTTRPADASAGLASAGLASAGLASAGLASASARRLVRASAAVGIVVALVAGVAGVRGLAADRLARRSLDALGSDPAVAIADARRAIELRGDVLRYRLLLARAEEARGTIASVDQAVEAVDAALSLSSADPVARGERARLLSLRASLTGDPASLRVAYDAYRTLVDEDPHRAEWQYGLGLAAAAVGEVTVAASSLDRAIFLAPEDPRPARALQRLRDSKDVTG